MSGPSRSTLTGRIFDVVVDHFADQLLGKPVSTRGES